MTRRWSVIRMPLATQMSSIDDLSACVTCPPFPGAL
jgi:hypothetical protein